ncbi:MAG: Methionine aminopeptidase [Chlamydiia bacterium]|nr:Methionine aminopeptidase [Chlamydiia bacterium]
MISRNDPCFCGSGKKYKKCHYPEKPPETPAQLAKEYEKKYDIILKTKEQIDGIRKACKFSAMTLKTLCEAAKEGVTTKELDNLAREICRKGGARAASLNYGSPPFQGAICTSINEVICHGIPEDRKLVSGDIMNIDCACILDGYFGDCSAMVMIGDVSDENRHLVEVTHEAMMRGIKILKPGVKIYEIGEAIESYATSEGYSVVNAFVSHGVGLEFHEEPQVPHHYNNVKTPLAPGMTFTVEPMINVGVREAVIDKNDRWTARTADNKPSAQWEHTVLITQDGYEILTKP